MDNQSSGSVLSLDVGDVRIGVAVSESRVIASTLPAINRKAGKKATLNALQEIVDSKRVDEVVIGLPYLESGAKGEQAEKTEAFARSLARRFPNLQIHFRDERYSSSEAKDILGGDNQEKGRVDSVAAAVILQSFLDEKK